MTTSLSDYIAPATTAYLSMGVSTDLFSSCLVPKKVSSMSTVLKRDMCSIRSRHGGEAFPDWSDWQVTAYIPLLEDLRVDQGQVLHIMNNYSTWYTSLKQTAAKLTGLGSNQGCNL